MALVNTNAQFAGGKAANLNFAGTNFSADTSLDAPQTQGRGVDAANSSWIATIYSKKVLKFFRTASVVEAITNNDYYGEIANYGDSVVILKEPRINVVDYSRGKKLSSQAIDSDSMTLVLDQAKAFQFQVDDIEKKLSHVNWQSLATESAAYELKNDYDRSVLEFMAEAVLPKNIVASTAGMAAIASASTGAAALATIAATGANVLQIKATPTETELSSGKAMDPLDLMNKFNLLLDIAEVPEEGRWIVVDPEFLEVAMRIDSKLLNRDFNDGSASVKNGLVAVNPIRGLRMYKTNNAPKLVTAGRPQSDTKLADAGRVILAGHMSAVATASAIVKTEVLRSHESFGDIVRGLHVYGRGVVRSESLCAAAVTYKAVKA